MQCKATISNGTSVNRSQRNVVYMASHGQCLSVRHSIFAENHFISIFPKWLKVSIWNQSQIVKPQHVAIPCTWDVVTKTVFHCALHSYKMTWFNWYLFVFRYDSSRNENSSLTHWDATGIMWEINRAIHNTLKQWPNSQRIQNLWTNPENKSTNRAVDK